MKLTLTPLNREHDNAQVYEMCADGVHVYEVLRVTSPSKAHKWTTAALNYEPENCNARARVDAVIGTPGRFDGLASVKRWMRSVERCAEEVN